MKKLKVVFSTLAVLAAIGGTFATQYTPSATITGYEWTGVICQERPNLECHVGENATCTLNEIPMHRENKISSTCGQVLTKNE